MKEKPDFERGRLARALRLTFVRATGRFNFKHLK